MKTKTKTKLRNDSLIFVVTLVGIFILLNVLSVHFFARWDLTKADLFTLSKASTGIVKSLDDQLLVKAYFTKNLPGRYATLERHVHDLLEEYQSSSNGNMKVEFIDPAGNEDEEKIAESLGIQKMPNPDIEKDQATVKEGYRGISLSYGDKKEVIKAVETTVGLEYALTTALKKIVGDKSEIAFLTGHGEPEIEPAPDPRQQMQPQPQEKPGAFQTIRKNLDIYDYKQVKLGKKDGVPKEAVALVISGPTEKFSDADLFYIDQFLMKGGSVAVFLDGVKVSVQPAQYPGMPAETSTTINESNIKDLLKHYGVEIGNKMVMDAQAASFIARCAPIPIPIPRPYPAWPLVTSFGADHPVTYGINNATFPFAVSVRLTKAALQDKNIKGQEIAFSSGNSWTVAAEGAVVDPCQMTISDRLESSLPLAAALTGKFTSYFKGKKPPKDIAEADSKTAVIEKSEKPGRLVVIGSAGLPTDENISTLAKIDRRQALGNFVFVQNILDWMTNDEGLIAVRMKSTADAPINKDISEGLKTTLKYGNIVGIPLLFMLFGLVRWRIRRSPKKSRA